MSRRHADIWSHPGHYLVDPYTWPWSPNGHGYEWPTTPTLFVQCQSALPFWDTAFSNFDHENPWSRTCMWSKVEVTFDLENSKSRSWVKSNPLVTFQFEACSSMKMFAFCFMDHFLPRYSKLHILLWKFKVKVMGQGQTRWSYFRPRVQSICLLFVSWQSDHFGCDIANSIFDLENWTSRSRPKSNQIIFRSGPTIVPKMKEIQKVVQKLLRGHKSAAGGCGASSSVWTGTKTLSHPRYTGVT